MPKLTGVVSGVVIDNDGLHLVVFPPGETEHACRVLVPLDLQMAIVEAILQRLAGKARQLAWLAAGHPVDSSHIS